VFLVCATQNPIEFEGTYPLPEAQLDRFFVRVQTEYPSDDEERALLTRVAHGFDARDLAAIGIETVASVEDVLTARRVARGVYVSESLVEYVRAIVARTRRAPELAHGASPRAGIALLVAAQTHASLEGNDFATPDDVKAVASMVLAHRTIVRPEAEIEGATAERVVATVLATVEVPKEATLRVAAT
jgi:MoxR-like ATPase